MGNFDLIKKALTEATEKYKAKTQGISIKKKEKEIQPNDQKPTKDKKRPNAKDKSQKQD